MIQTTPNLSNTLGQINGWNFQKRWRMEDDVPFQMGLFLASMLIFQGVIWTCGHGISMIVGV